MTRFDGQDVLAGALITATGIFCAVYALSNYQIGTIHRMGTGMFPFGVGILLAVMGLLVTVPALMRRGTFARLNLRGPLAVILGVSAFAALVTPFGLVPAIFAVTIISSFGEKRPNVVRVLLLCVALSVLAYLIFKLALKLPMSVFAWPF